MKKFFCMISAIIFSLTVCFSCAFALAEKSPKKSIETLDQYGDLLIQWDSDTHDLWLYDAQQEKILFSTKLWEHSDDGEWCNSLHFTKNGRILFSTWTWIPEGDISQNVQIFELSPDGEKKTLLTEEYAITGKDIAGRFMCMTAGQSITHYITKELFDNYDLERRIDGVPL